MKNPYITNAIIPNSMLTLFSPPFSFMLLHSVCECIYSEFQYPITRYLKGFKNIYPHPSAPVLPQILFTWPLVFFTHRNTWLLFHYELTGSATTMPAYSMEVFTSSPSLCLTVSVVSRPLCYLPNFDAPSQTFVFQYIQNSSCQGGGERESISLVSYPCTTSTIIEELNIPLCDECHFLLSPMPGFKKLPHTTPAPFESSVKKFLILTYLASLAIFLNHFLLPPPAIETLVSNLSVCFFQIPHLFLRFHPLGL